MVSEKFNDEEEFRMRVEGYLHKTFEAIQVAKCKEFYMFAVEITTKVLQHVPLDKVSLIAQLAYQCKSYIDDFSKIWGDLDELLDCIIFVLSDEELGKTIDDISVREWVQRNLDCLKKQMKVVLVKD